MVLLTVLNCKQLFIFCGLFNDTVSILDFRALNGSAMEYKSKKCSCLNKFEYFILSLSELFLLLYVNVCVVLAELSKHTSMMI